MTTILFLNIGAGLLLAALSIPLVLRKIKPNGLYGFRVNATLEDPALWYEVNAYSGWRLLAAGITAVISAVVLYFIPGISLDTYALGCMGLTFVVLGIGMVQSVIYMRQIQKKGMTFMWPGCAAF